MIKEFSAATGAPLPADPDPDPEQFLHLPLSAIVPSPSNPRKRFSDDTLTELAESIQTSAVHVPVLVRPLPGSRLQDTRLHTPKGQALPTHELVVGERRYRASLLAGAKTIPAMVRNLTDHQVLELQIVENLQRDNLSAIEEADAYHRLLHDNGGMQLVTVARKIGKSRAYVESRLRLLDLCGEASAALQAGQIDVSRALLIARIPDSKLQLKALAEATRTDGNSDVTTVRALQVWLRQNVMLRLDTAPFRVADPRLVPAAGSCLDCPKRTGANPDLFADIDGADLCTDPPCYNNKALAHHESLIAKAHAKGLQVIDGAEAKRICHKEQGLVGYSPLSQVRDDAIGGWSGSRLGQLLGSDYPGKVLIENPWTRELIEAVPTEEAEAWLITMGLLKSDKADKASKQTDADHDIAGLKSQLDRHIEERFRHSAFDALLAIIRATPEQVAPALITPRLLRAWLTDVVADYGADTMATAFGIPEIQDNEEIAAYETALRLHIQACPAGALYRALAVYMIEADNHVHAFGGNAPPAIFEALASDLQVDLAAIRASATAEVKAEHLEKIRQIKAGAKTGAKAKPAPKGNGKSKPAKVKTAEPEPPAEPLQEDNAWPFPKTGAP
jgi:ParB/RepB/Spo0J family partition protein